MSGLIEMTVRHRQLAVFFHGDPAIDQMVLCRPELKEVADRLRELLEGPERNTADRVAYAVFLSGVAKAAANPELLDIDDADLHRALLDLSERILATTTQGTGRRQTRQPS